MRKTLVFLFMLSVKLAFCQINETFNDGDFTQKPMWIGDVSLFNVNNVKELQSNLASTSQSVSLATINLLATNVKWEFDLKLTFDPSTTNQVKIYLTSSQSDLKALLEGYFIQIGEAGSADSYDLYRQNGTMITKIIDGPPKSRANANLLAAKLRITRDHLGRWELFTAIDSRQEFILEGTATDLELTNCSFFGINCTYSVTRSDGFFFDNFQVEELTPDVFPPRLLNVKVIDEQHVDAIFSETLDFTSAMMAKNYLLQGFGNPANVVATFSPNVYRLTFSSALPTGEYTLATSFIKDLKGNTQTLPNSFSFFYSKPYVLKSKDLLISEILFNPKLGGVDFVEIYNNTNQMLDLKGLKLTNSDTKGSPANIKEITSTSIYMPAKTYWVLTTNVDIVKQSYRCRFPKQFISMSSLPAFNNDKGTAILLSDDVTIDQFDYTEKMHSPLLKDVDGVALERISLTEPTNAVGNFTSAAMDVGFATPTNRNSATNDELIVKNSVDLASSTFSPDDDGFEDLLQIKYQFVNPGNFATVTIYNDRGVLVRKLQRNTSIATSGNFNWDGLNDSGVLNKVGIYIIKFDTFNLNGVVNTFRKTCVLAARFR